MLCCIVFTFSVSFDLPFFEAGFEAFLEATFLFFFGGCFPFQVLVRGKTRGKDTHCTRDIAGHTHSG